MTDFVSRLEAELLAAARRRSARRRPRRPSLRPVLVTATVLAAVLAAVTVPRPAPDERAATPGSFAVPAIAAPEICDPPVRLTARTPKRRCGAGGLIDPAPGRPAAAGTPGIAEHVAPGRRLERLTSRPAAMTGPAVSAPTTSAPDRWRAAAARAAAPARASAYPARHGRRCACAASRSTRSAPGRAFALIAGERLVGIVPIGRSKST